jgi:hypothetical protein
VRGCGRLSFKGRPLADGFLTSLKDAVRDRRPFNPHTGLPEAETTEGEMITWYQHARAYAEAKWGNLAPVSRRGPGHRHHCPHGQGVGRARGSQSVAGQPASRSLKGRPPGTREQSADG